MKYYRLRHVLEDSYYYYMQELVEQEYYERTNLENAFKQYIASKYTY